MLQVWMPEADGVWHWSVGEQWTASATLEQLIRDLELYANQEMVVFFPSRHVQLLQHTLPRAQYKQLGQEGAVYLLEEYVALSIEALQVHQHFEAPETLTLLGIAKADVETFQHALTLLPTKIVALLPDFLLLPVPEAGQTVLANIQGRLLAREHAYMGTSIDDLNLYLDYQRPEQHYKCSGLNAAQQQALATSVLQSDLSEFSYQLSILKKAKQHPWNVLPKVKPQAQSSGYWGACAAVLAAVILAQLAYDGLRWYQLKQVADQTAVQAVEQYKTWFGAQSRVSEQNLKSQFESQLRLSQQADTQALQLLSRVGPVLMQHQIVAEQVNYEAARLDLSLTANSSQNLQNLTQQLNQQGFKVQLGNITPQPHGVMGQLSIE